MVVKGIVFDIQHYAIYDGPGIRTLVFLKGCPLHCQWCHNPESQEFQAQIAYIEEKCTRCEKCILTCPVHARSFTEHIIRRDSMTCTRCGICAKTCPNKAVEKIGKELTVEQVVSEIEGDQPFYDSSGGGITISGGEPTAQPEFLVALLQKLKELNFHTTIETCGHFSQQLLDELLKYVDLFLYDVKLINADQHKVYTGVNPDLIQSNFAKIMHASGPRRIIPRIPLIPGVNTSMEAIWEIITFLQQVGYIGPIHLMPYNKMIKTKYQKVGKEVFFKDFGTLSEEDMKKITTTMELQHFEVVCND